MRFSTKIFLAVFISAFLLGTTLLVVANKYTTSTLRSDFLTRYQVLTKVLADNLTRYDRSTEVIMMNAAKVIEEIDAQKGLLSTEELRALQRTLGVTHVFITDKNGKFIRSTNEDPNLIPNIFSFSDNYKLLIQGGLDVEATPVIKPDPEPKPFKFLSIANRSLTRIIEVGVRVDFIATTLMEANNSDPNLLSTTLYAPDGTPFGQFENGNASFETKKAELPIDLSLPVFEGNEVYFYTKVASSHSNCSQCNKSGTSRNGEYYYVLKSKVSASELNATLAQTTNIFWLLGFINFLFALGIAKFLAKRMLSNVRNAVARVRSLKTLWDSQETLEVEGNDEIAFLTNEFSKALDTIAISQKQLLETEKVKSTLNLARTVAHNIKSPALAIEMMLPGLINVPDGMRRVLSNAAKEIRHLSDQLTSDSNRVMQLQNEEVDTGLVFLPLFLDDLLKQKRFEYLKDKNVEIKFSGKDGCRDAFAKVNSVECKSILSNIINNAVESYPDRKGIVEISLESDDKTISIVVADNGAGIPEEYAKELGKRAITFKGEQTRGLGLMHAFKMVQSWGGNISVDSKVGVGTKFKISLPKYVTQQEVKFVEAVI
jgi:signal transduction histidine kinase